MTNHHLNTITECPECGEPEPMFLAGEGDELDMLSCPECGWEVFSAFVVAGEDAPPAAGASSVVMNIEPVRAASIEAVQAATLHSVAVVREGLGMGAIRRG